MKLKKILFRKEAVRNEFVFQKFWAASFFCFYAMSFCFGCESLRENPKTMSTFQIKNYVYEFLKEYAFENDFSDSISDCELQEISIEVAESALTDGEEVFSELIDAICSYEFFDSGISFEFLSLEDFLLEWPVVQTDENF
ncbi:MAG: hypothetical protein K6G52_07345 [Treponemataceae bacterium]|nr:hypothetical protein [Treponemataceae bacterium]